MIDWKSAARAWWERLNKERARLVRERLKNTELLQKLKNTENKAQGFYEDLNVLSERHRQERVKNAELLQKLGEERANANEWLAQWNDARKERAELLRELEQEREMRAVIREQLFEEAERAKARERELRDALSKLQSESEDCEGELRARLRWTESRLEAKQDEHAELLQKIEELRAQLSGNPGEFAALAERIAYADGKKPRDLPDTSHDISAERVKSRLERARTELEAFPAWDNAFECEVAEASAELALGNPERLADELLDVATVAMRWRRAVLERGKR